MPTYEYRCRTCDVVFEQRRPMSQSDAAATCPSGHAETVKLLSVFASVGATGGEPAAPAPAPAMRGCGGACACHP